jgi:hypothetical protein
MGSRGLWAVCVSASFAVMLVGCSKEGTVNPVSPAAVSAADLAAKSGSAIPATGVFRDLSTDYLRSDGLGPYVDGSQGVSSHIDILGDYDLNTKATGTAKRWLYVATIPSYTGCAVPFQNQLVSSYFASQNAGLSSMAVGSSKPVELTVAMGTTSNWTWNVNFRPSKFPETSYLTATRTGTNTWTIEAVSATGKIIQDLSKGNNPCGDAYGLSFLVTVSE